MISHVAPGQDDLGADVGAEDLLRQHHEVGSYLGADLDCGLLVPVEYMNGGPGGGLYFVIRFLTQIFNLLVRDLLCIIIN